MAKQKSNKKVSDKETRQTSQSLASCPPPPNIETITSINSPKVAVALCVYNEPPKYVKECIESIINQTYKNLEIAIVNNGVLIEECAILLREYAKKDSRITLIEREINKSPAHGFNGVLDYLKGKYAIQKISSAHQGLETFQITNDNPYTLQHILKAKDLDCETKADFLLIHCADDTWELNLVEECLKHSEGVDIVWFADNKIVEVESAKFDWTLQSIFHYDTEPAQIITQRDWLERAIAVRQNHFWFIWQGMINFEFFSKINVGFLPYIAHDDVYFGTFLFLNASKIYVLPKKLYNYRIRAGSDSNIDGKVTEDCIVSPLKPLLQVFDGNLPLIRYFHKSVSFMVMGLYLQDYIQDNLGNPNIPLIQQAFMPFFHERYLDFLYFLNHFNSQMDTDTYFTICFNIIFHLLENFKKDEYVIEPFKDLGDPRIIKTKERARAIAFAKDMLYLENSHIVRLNQEKQALQNALTQAQERIKMLESMLMK